MKKNNIKTVSVTMSSTKVPQAQAFNFIPGEAMTRDEFVAKSSRNNLQDCMFRHGMTLVMGGVGVAVTKGLSAMGDKTGKRGFYAAAAITGALTAIGTSIASNRVMNDVLTTEAEIHKGLWCLPEKVRTWKQVSAAEAEAYAEKMQSLGYDEEKDGPMTVEELIDKRTNEVCSSLAKSGITYPRFLVRKHFEEGDFKTIEALTGCTDIIRNERTRNEELSKEVEATKAIAAATKETETTEAAVTTKAAEEDDLYM